MADPLPLVRATCLAAALLLADAASATAAPASIQAANLSPVVHIFGLPRATQAPHAADETRVQLGLDWASHAVSDRKGQAYVQFDGETRRYTLSASGPAGGGGAWWAVEVPLIRHTGGILDGLIEPWHDTFGLPEGNRPNRPRDKLLFRVADDTGKEVLRQDADTTGVGDLALAAGLPLRGLAGLGGNASAGVRVEAPTGDPDRLMGSGGWDFAAWLASRGALPYAPAWGWHAAGGLLYMSKSEVLSDQHRKQAGFGRLAASWRPLRPLGLRAQLDGHTAMYNSPLTPLGEAAVELRMAAAWHPGRGYRMEAGFSEDLSVGTAPDVTFHLRLSRGHR